MPYDDSQARDKDGKRTSGGSSGGGLPPSAYAAGMAKAPSSTPIKGAHAFNSLSEARKFANTSHGYARVLTRGNETIVALDRNVTTSAVKQGVTPVTVLGATRKR